MNAALAARYALGVIRLVNGTLALVIPARLVKMFGEDPKNNGPALYALRLFGVRTVVIGAQLLLARGGALEDALRYALPIHASDTASAAIAGVKGHLPRKAAITVVVVSSLNTVLAYVANPRRGD